jgi:hypothetical protein
MHREGIRQRIRYLIEHGGAYPEEPPDKRHTIIIVMLAVVALLEIANLLLR